MSNTFNRSIYMYAVQSILLLATSITILGIISATLLDTLILLILFSLNFNSIIF